MNAGACHRLHVLGPVDLRHSDGRPALSVLAQPRRVALLVYLAVEARAGWVQRDALLPLFWPDSTEEQARTALRGALYFLRQSLGADPIEATGSNLRLATGVECDAVRFLEAREAGDHALALELYGGPFLDGFHASGLASFERWQEGMRRHLHREAARSALALADAAERSGQPAVAVEHLRRAVALAPTDEDGLRRLLRTLEAAGDRAGAVETYEAWASDLFAAFGLEPSHATASEIERIRSVPADVGAPAHAPAAPPAVGSDPPAAPTAAATDSPRLRVGAALPGAAREPSGRAWRTNRSLVAVTATGLAATLFAAAALGRVGWGNSVVEPRAASQSVVAVLPFATGGGVPDYYGAALPHLVGAALGRFPELWPLDPAALLDQMAAEPGQDPSRMATDMGAGLIVTGSARADAERITIEASLVAVHAPRRDLATAKVEGTAEELATLTGRLVDALLEARGSLSRTPASPLTADARALEPFVMGEEAFRRGRYAEAESAYARAVTLDSTFALAHYRRSTAAEWLGMTDSARVAADRALVHSHRLGPHARQLLDAWRAELWGDIGPALQAYGRLAASSPTDVQTWLRLGELRFHWGPLFGITPAETDSAFAEVMRLSPGHAGAMLHRIRVAGRQDDVAAVADFAAHIRALGPPSLEALQLDLLETLLAGRPASPHELERLAALDGGAEWQVLAASATSVPDPAAVLGLLDALPDDPEPDKRLHRLWLRARILAGTGRHREALAVVDEAAELSPARATELRAALLLARTQPPPTPEAERLADALLHGVVRRPDAHYEEHARDVSYEGIFEPRRMLVGAMLERAAGGAPLDTLTLELSWIPSRYSAQYIQLLSAWNASRTWDAAGALGHLTSPATEPDFVRPGALSYPLAIARWIRAEALLALGRDDEALAWFLGFPEPNGSDLMFAAPARLRSAEILERAGRLEEAAEQYRLALRLWRVADGDLAPLVDSARRGLARVTR